MTQVTQVAFLIDFNSFPIVSELQTNLDSSDALKACITYDVTNGTASGTPKFSTPTAGVSAVNREQSCSGPSRIGPTVSKEDRGERSYCLYPTLQAYTRTPPRMLALDSASDCSDYDDWPGSEERQIREDQIAENLQAVKEIILERLEMASLVNGRLETENVQWSYQFFDSSREVIKTKSNAKKFFKLDLEAIDNFEQTLGQELAAFVHGKRKFERQKKKMVTNGSNYLDQEDSNRLTCLSSALKNIMSDIPWIDASGPANTKYNNMLYILHHLPSNEKEVNNFANGHIPVGKSLHPKLLRDALLPPAFLTVLRDKLQIKLNFVDISCVGKRMVSEIGTGNETDGTVMDDESRKIVLVIQKMLQMLHAKHEMWPQRQCVPLHFGSWYMLLKGSIEGASLRAQIKAANLVSGQKNVNMMLVPFVDKKAEREKKRVSADSGGGWKEHDALRRSDRKRDARDPNDRDHRSVRTLAVVTANDPVLHAAEMSPRVKVGAWLGSGNVYASSSQDGSQTSEAAVSVDSFNLDEYTSKCGFGESSSRKVVYKPYDQRRLEETKLKAMKQKVDMKLKAIAVEHETRLAITHSQKSKSSGQYDYEAYRNRTSTSLASRGTGLIKRKSGENEPSCNMKPQQPPPNTSYLSLRNPRRPIEIAKTSKNGRGRPKGSKNVLTKALVPFTGGAPSLPQFGKGYGTRSKSHGDKPPQLFALPDKGWRPSVSAIAYVAPQLAQTMPGHKKDNTSPPNRVNVKRNLDNVFNSFGEQRGDQQRQQSTSASKHASANKRSAGQNRSKTASQLSQPRVLKSKRKLQMDDEGIDNNPTARPSHGATIQDKGHGIRGTSSALATNRASPTTPQHKRLKRLANSSAEKTVIQESPQVDRRPIRARGKGGLPKVDPVSFYSYGSNESKAWEISGQKLAAQRMQDSVEDSKGVLQNLSSHNLEYDNNEFEILASSSPECGPDSNKKRKLEAENSVKYFHVPRPPTLPQSPLALYSTPPAKAVAAEEKSPCLFHYVISEKNKLALPEDTQGQTVMQKSESESCESKEVKEKSDNQVPELDQQQPIQLANTIPESLTVEVESEAAPLPLAPIVNTESVPMTDIQIPKFTPPPRKAKQRSAATSSAMMASFSSTSSSDCTAPDIDALMNREILNTPTPRKKRVARNAAVTVDTSTKAPTPTRHSNRTPKPKRDLDDNRNRGGLLSPDIADVAANKAKQINAAIELVKKRTPRQTAAAKRKQVKQAETPKTPPASITHPAASLSFFSPSPTPTQPNQRTPQRGGSCASSSNTSQRQFLYSDTTPDKMHEIDFSQFGRRHRPIVLQATPSPVHDNESNANFMEEVNDDVNTETPSLTTAATTTTDETTSTMSAAKTKTKRKPRRKKGNDWGFSKRPRTRKRNLKTDSTTDEQSDESSSFGLTPTPSPLNLGGQGGNPYAGDFSS